MTKPKPVIPKAQLLEMYRQMLRIRRFEENAAEQYTRGKIRGFLHLYIGEEAIAVGTMAALDPADALGLLRSALKEEDPVLFCEHALLYSTRGEVPAERYEIPLGKARIAREGKDVMLVGNARMVHVALQAAEELAQRGVQAEVIDLRTIRPLDIPTVVASVKKTHRCLIIDEARKTGSIGTYLGFRVQQETFDMLDAPVAHIGGEDVPMPYAKNLELLSIPSVTSVLKALKDQIGI